MSAILPRIEISLSQIKDNARSLTRLYSPKGITLMGVTKSVLGEPAIAEAMIQGGVEFIADSRIENIQKMKKAGLATQFVLLRTPPSQADTVVRYADISINTELETLKLLSYHAKASNKFHKVIIMVELGDLREGVLPCDLLHFFRQALQLTHLKLIGIGCNLACYGGIKPSDRNMNELSEIAIAIENEFKIELNVISGGNSANYEWFKSTLNTGRINNLRLGEAILLGRETLNRHRIPGLHTGAFTLVAEVIESKQKASIPSGQVCQNAFGEIPVFKNLGTHQRAIIALGSQDIQTSSLKALDKIEILGSSSDHIIINSRDHRLLVGDEVGFNLDYGGLLAAMTSPFIGKQFVYSRSHAAA